MTKQTTNDLKNILSKNEEVIGDNCELKEAVDHLLNEVEQFHITCIGELKKH